MLYVGSVLLTTFGGKLVAITSYFILVYKTELNNKTKHELKNYFQSGEPIHNVSTSYTTPFFLFSTKKYLKNIT